MAQLAAAELKTSKAALGQTSQKALDVNTEREERFGAR